MRRVSDVCNFQGILKETEFVLFPLAGCGCGHEQKWTKQMEKQQQKSSKSLQLGAPALIASWNALTIPA